MDGTVSFLFAEFFDEIQLYYHQVVMLDSHFDLHYFYSSIIYVREMGCYNEFCMNLQLELGDYKDNEGNKKQKKY